MKPPAPKEIELHIAFAEAVRVSINPGWRWTHLPMGEYRTDATAGKLKRMGVHAGWPDFIFVGKPGGLGRLMGDGVTAYIELKRPGERPTKEQIEMMGHLSNCGAFCLATDSVGDALAFLYDLGAVRAIVMA